MISNATVKARIPQDVKARAVIALEKWDSTLLMLSVN